MKLKHPDSPHVIDVAPEQAPLYKAQGWREVPPGGPRSTRKRSAAPRK